MNGYDETETFGYGYPEDDEDENERDDRLTRVAVFMNMLPEAAFSEALFENACYMANVDPDSFSEEEIEELMNRM